MTTTYNLPGQCPACGHKLDAATSVDGHHVPKPGDLSVCIKCAAFLTFDDSHRLLLLTAEAMAELDDDDRNTLLRVRRVIKDDRDKTKGAA